MELLGKDAGVFRLNQRCKDILKCLKEERGHPSPADRLTEYGDRFSKKLQEIDFSLRKEMVEKKTA